MKNYIKIILLSFFARVIIQLIFFLNKIVIVGEKNLIQLLDLKQPIMVCVWHGRFLFPSWYLRSKTINVHAIASNNYDGEIMGRVLKS